MNKIRADQRLVECGLCESRSAAQQLIKDQRVAFADSAQPLRKPGQMVAADAQFTLDDQPRFVSRGAGKLLAAINAFNPDIAGKVALDIGASTGGFTDVLLSYGAGKVYAVDVGTAQLHEKLRRDPRVISLEQTNARDLNRTLIPEPIALLVADLSFISLTKVLPACAPLLAPAAWIIVLVKPQFEAEPHDIGKGGVVRDDAVRRRAIQSVVACAQQQCHWQPLGVIPSPVLGPKGNQEYLAAFRNP
ncbi:MAG: TlyA family RNA methyltransferase [Lentisphaerae bacterium]|nr:TlyA family RNA methyltransferase [Lentisphaerota bacterium]